LRHPPWFAFLPAAVGADKVTGGAALTGAVTALTALAGVLIQPAARALDAFRWRWSVGPVGLLTCAAGLTLGAYTVQASSLWLLSPCAAVLGCAYGLCLVSGLIEVGRLAHPDAVGSLTAVCYALAYLGFAPPYLLTLASPLADYRTLLLILAAMALAGAAIVATEPTLPSSCGSRSLKRQMSTHVHDAPCDPAAETDTA
jgi:hypothetical protein